MTNSRLMGKSSLLLMTMGTVGNDTRKCMVGVSALHVLETKADSMVPMCHSRIDDISPCPRSHRKSVSVPMKSLLGFGDNQSLSRHAPLCRHPSTKTAHTYIQRSVGRLFENISIIGPLVFCIVILVGEVTQRFTAPSSGGCFIVVW
ncbi:hypothetical protein NCU17043 [Neurospora crassa OR74A]|uniref:Uncharacterized protein n=1 Tax=Neurospora crassa (strain ATCC 24698 / 74-OR23-1A / CBS 708.71 / DSM 1257 / FGSC 987) TaxID=367110 RepID=V5IM26_NEUCR|nr:hypothetical protein NCU17043 [Neurospora crassa OR74A]ESA42722.1 hypothetical protein NCU17043 [Neurospora crassa OR74A]|eukprot:XP_011394857.1 hypothetical protein NCU17043 [Neurospora crassa OR74A]